MPQQEDIKKLQADPTIATSGSVGRTGAGFVDLTTGQAITGADLEPTERMNFERPTEPPVPSVGSLESPAPEAPAEEVELTPTEQKIQSQLDDIQAFQDRLIGQSQFTTEQEELAGVAEFKQTEKDLSAQLRGLIAESKAIPLQIQQQFTARGVTAAGAAPIQTSALRENAIKSLSVSAQLDATQGLLSSALDKVDQAVKAKYDPAESSKIQVV